MKKDLYTGPLLGHLDSAEYAYEQVFALFKNWSPELPDEMLDYLKEHTQVVTFPKGSVILDYGQVCRSAYIILQGIVKASELITDTRERTVWFLCEGDVVVAVESFYSQTPSHEKLTVLDAVTCIDLPKTTLEALYRLFPRMNDVGRIMAETYHRQARERMRLLHNLQDARERYLHLADHYPHIIRNIKVREIAGLLDVDPSTLSRIRARLRRNGDQ